MNLFRVITKKSYGKYSTFYVVAEDPTTAYSKVREFLDSNDLCFSNDRAMKTIELIADSNKYGSCEDILL